MEKNPFIPEGRIRRTTFWFRAVIVFLSIYITLFIAIYLEKPMILVANANVAFLLLTFFFIQGVKRVHDVDKSWWYAFVPFYNVVLFAQEGQEGANRYGADPKGQRHPIKISRKKRMRIDSPTGPVVREVGVRPQIKIKKRS